MTDCNQELNSNHLNPPALSLTENSIELKIKTAAAAPHPLRFLLPLSFHGRKM
jgi:hypothetical protein